MTPVYNDPSTRVGQSQQVCGRCGKPSTVLVLDPGKPYVYLCASCEANDPSKDGAVGTSDTSGGNPV